MTQGPLPEGQQPSEDMANGMIPEGGMPPNGDGNGAP